MKHFAGFAASALALAISAQAFAGTVTTDGADIMIKTKGGLEVGTTDKAFSFKLGGRIQAGFGDAPIVSYQIAQGTFRGVRLLPDYRATVASENFGVDATYELLLPDQNIPALETALTELTDGAVLITRLDDDTMPPETP